jgi:hypothetical protein
LKLSVSELGSAPGSSEGDVFVFYDEIVEVSFTYCELRSTFERITFRENVGVYFITTVT